MICNKCGYALSDFDSHCPRCHRVVVSRPVEGVSVQNAPVQNAPTQLDDAGCATRVLMAVRKLAVTPDWGGDKSRRKKIAVARDVESDIVTLAEKLAMIAQSAQDRIPPGKQQQEFEAGSYLEGYADATEYTALTAAYPLEKKRASQEAKAYKELAQHAQHVANLIQSVASLQDTANAAAASSQEDGGFQEGGG